MWGLLRQAFGLVPNFEIGCIRLRLQPLERSPGGILANARLSGPRVRLSSLPGYVLFWCLNNPSFSDAMLLSSRIWSTPFVETRQSAFILQA
jgi:hypothetical protein